MFLNVNLAKAQTRPGSIRGKVIEKSNGVGIAFANIAILDSVTIISGGSSDFNGNFNLNPIKPGIYNVEVSSVGYKTITLKGV